MSRSYKGKRPKANRVYSVADVQDLYGVCRNTVSNWVGSGLSPAEGGGAQLFRGAELARFHAERRARSRSELLYGEFKCIGCKAAVFPDYPTLSFSETSQGKTMAQGLCPDCSAVVMKILGETECNMIQNCIDANTSLSQIDVGKETKRGCIGKKPGKVPREWHSANDRIVFEWQAYAGRYDTKTVDAHLNSIRHRASQLSQFFTWLCTQEGYKRLNKGLPGHFVLPRGATARALSPPPKPFPTIDEAVLMASEMPVCTRLDRRHRAIFALTFVSGFRAGALISLRLRHVDIDGKRAVHDAADIRAKNGKSYTANWFPRTEPLQQFVAAWIAELLSLDAGQNDALFPSVPFLAAQPWFKETSRAPIEPMRTSLAVTEAFKAATSNAQNDYSPHSARHCLAALGEKLCHSSEEKKAWSLNLGHSSEQVTQTHYAKVTHARKCEIFEEFNEIGIWTDEEKDLMLDYHDHKLQPGTPEFQRAKTLVVKRAGTQDV